MYGAILCRQKISFWKINPQNFNISSCGISFIDKLLNSEHFIHSEHVIKNFILSHTTSKLYLTIFEYWKWRKKEKNFFRRIITHTLAKLNLGKQKIIAKKFINVPFIKRKKKRKQIVIHCNIKY